MTLLAPSTVRRLSSLAMFLLLAVGSASGGAAAPTACIDSQTRAVVTGGTNGLRAVHAVDFDGDGDLDVISASANDDKIIFWRNEAPLDEYTEILVSGQADGAIAVAVADIDGDCDLDVISASSNDDKIAWYQSIGDGLFVERTISLDADVATDLFVADMDFDGDVDVVASSFNDDAIRLFKSDNNPVFDPMCNCDTPLNGSSCVINGRVPNFKEFIVAESADGATSVYAAQLLLTPGDERLEIVSASRFDSRIVWYEERPIIDGSVDPPIVTDESVFIPRVVDSGAIGVSSVIAADIDDDGFVDLASSSTEGRVSWFENNQMAIPGFAKHLVNATTAQAAQVIAADVDRDGDQDLVASSPSAGSVSWFENLDGLGGFGNPLTNAAPIAVGIPGADGLFAVESPMMEPFEIFVAASVAATIAGNDRLARFESDGGMPPAWSGTTIGQSSVAPIAMLVIDVEEQELAAGDGDMDVVIASAVDNDLLLFRNDGLMPPTFTRETISNDARGANSLAWGDLDGDGLRDLVASLANDDALAWYRNLGGATFGDPAANRIDISALANDIPSSVAIADLDGDGDLDVVSTSSGDDRIAWYANLLVPDAPATPADLFGDPFGNQILLADDALGAQQAIAVDLNADGCAEIVAVSSEDDAVRWFLNPSLGGGACEGPSADDVQRIEAEFPGARAVAAHDMDKDGDADLVVAAADADVVMIVDNGFVNADPDSSSGDPLDLSSVRQVAVGLDFVRGVALANLDGTDDAEPGDNPRFAADVDIVAIGSGSDEVSWFESLLNSFARFPRRCSVTEVGCEIDSCGRCSVSLGFCAVDEDCPTDQSCDAICLLSGNDCSGGEAACNAGQDDCAAANFCEDDFVCTVSDVACSTDAAAESCEFAGDDCSGTCVMAVGTSCTMDSDCQSPDTCQATCAESGVDCTNQTDPDFCDDTCVLTAPLTRSCSVSGDPCTVDGDCPKANFCEFSVLRQTYNPRPLSDRAESVRSLAVADLDGDGVLDIVTGSFFEVLWHKGGAVEACRCFDVVGSGGGIQEGCAPFSMTGDREIDGGELSLLGAAFNKSCAAPGSAWWCDVDFSGDGLIDGDDLAILASFGVWGRVVAPDPDEDPENPELKSVCAYTCP